MTPGRRCTLPSGRGEMRGRIDPEIERLFHELADLSPAEREARLSAGRVPPAIRAEVEALLNFDAADDHSLTKSAERAERLVAEAAEGLAPSAVEEQEQSRCGPYRLLRLLGRGGM